MSRSLYIEVSSLPVYMFQRELFRLSMDTEGRTIPDFG